MSTLLEDIRYAARGLARTPLFTLAGIAILALGIGLNAVVFGLVDATVLRAAPFAEPERLVHVYQDSDEGAPGSTSFPAYREMAAMTDVFAGVAATAAAGATWEAPEAPRAVAIEFVTASYFPVLGLRTHLGSWFSPEHDRVGAEPVAVVTHRAWQTLFGADPAVVGRTVRLNGQSVTIVGVGPPNFNGQAGALITHFWLSISSTPVGGPFQVLNLNRPQDHWYQVQARLAPNVTLPEARAAMDGLAGRLAELNPELDSGRDITVFAHADVRFHPSLDGVLLASTTTMLVLASTVLLLGCSNLANLFLVRGFARGPEIAVRSALGAGWLRIARLLLAEALLLAALGGAAGLALAAFAVRFIPSLTLGLPVAGLDVRFDARLIAFGLLAALVTGLLFGLLPALRAARADVAASLRDEGRGRSAGRGLSLLRKGLVVAQVALSLVLVVAAGLLGRSLANAERVDLGFDAERIALLGTSLAQGGVEPADFQIVATEILERIAAVPGVERAALTTRLPAEGGGSASTVVEGYAPVTGTNAVEMPLALVSRGYFETLRIALVAGRSFSAVDRQDTPRVVMVNETAARLYWGGDAIGKRVRSQAGDEDWREVVGVVADSKVADLTEPATPMMYYSAEQWGVAGFTVVARTASDPDLLAGALTRALHEVRATLPVTRQSSMRAHIGSGLASARTVVAVTGGVSLIALLLAGMGIYAVVAFNVQRRSQELGVRMALGATSSGLARMVVGESVLVVAAGVAVGLGLAALVGRGLAVVLFGVEPMDAATFAGAAALLLATAAAAAFVPARRAASANPVEALRAQ